MVTGLILTLKIFANFKKNTLQVAEIPFVVSDKVESFRKTKEAVSFLHRANLWDDVEKVCYPFSDFNLVNSRNIA